MKLPEKIPNEVGTVWAENSIPYKLNQLIDYLAERENIQHIISLNGTTYQYSFLDSQWKEKEEKPTPLFKAEDIHTGQDYWGQEVLRGFPTKEAAEQAREALLKLSK